MKAALIFWWLALTPQPNVGMSSSVTVGGPGGGQSEVVVQGIHQMKPVLFDDGATCMAELVRLAELHKDDFVLLSTCGRASSAIQIIPEAK